MNLQPSSAVTALKPSPLPLVLTTALELLPLYDGFIVDLWGVTHDGVTPYAGALAFFVVARQAGKKLVFLSNSSSIIPLVAAQLRGMGVTDYDALITSGSLVADYLRSDAVKWRDGFAGKVLVVGDASIFAQYNAAVTIVNNPPQAGCIINVWYGDSETDVLVWQDAMQHWRDLGLPMMCCNPDLVAHTQGVPVLCPGTFAAAYEAIGGIVHYFGKPHAQAFAAAVQALGLPSTDRIAMVGDNLYTDILGGVQAGLDTVLVLDGVHREQVGGAAGAIPDNAALASFWRAHRLQPTYVLPCL
jgi:HAD superfamily hydrolase (TIGR01459 family)